MVTIDDAISRIGPAASANLLDLLWLLVSRLICLDHAAGADARTR